MPEDPAAVAAREQRNGRLAVVLAGGFVGFLAFATYRWIKDTSQLMASPTDQNRWDV